MTADCSVAHVYGMRAEEYRALFGDIAHVAEPDRRLIERWASGIAGRVIDVGCGPGHWTDHLRRWGTDVEGVDPVPEFVAGARIRFPGTGYRIARAESLGGETAALGGVLAWYSLIHVPPDRIRAPLVEFARAVRPGGGLAVGFFTGPRPEPFAHAVTIAYRWPVLTLCDAVESAGFEVTHTETRTDPGSRPHGAILAVRRTRR